MACETEPAYSGSVSPPEADVDVALHQPDDAVHVLAGGLEDLQHSRAMARLNHVNVVSVYEERIKPKRGVVAAKWSPELAFEEESIAENAAS